jgi:hypothetical protein
LSKKLNKYLSNNLSRLSRIGAFACFTFIAATASMSVELAMAEPVLLTSTDRDRESVSLTIYNGNFAVVTDIREVSIPIGLVKLDFQDVSEFLEPSSILVTPVSAMGKNAAKNFTIEEQLYEHHTLNRNSLLRKFIGQKVKYSRSILDGVAYEKFFREGILLAINPEVVKFGDQIEIAPEGTISLPFVPEGVSLKPRLEWLIDNKKQGKQLIQTTYTTGKIGWSADYVMLLNPDKNQFDMTTWVTLSNESDNAFDAAEVVLVAGEVNRIAPKNRRRQSEMADAAMMSSARSNSIAPMPLMDYYQYVLPRITDLAPFGQKQIRLLEANAAAYKRRYTSVSESLSYRMADAVSKSAAVNIEINNDQKSGLGQPLPAGNVRAYLQSNNGQLVLLGESRMPHLAIDQETSLEIGRAFDIQVHRTQTSFKRTSERGTVASYEIKISNAKPTSVEVELFEKHAGDWELSQQSQKGEKIDSHTQRYIVKVPARSEKVVSYTVKTRN